MDQKLFADELPEGLRLLDEILSARQEADLAAWCDRQPWRSDLARRVQHYGYRYDYSARRVLRADRLGPLPDPLHQVAHRVARLGGSPVPEQVIINEYLPGQGIARHVDCVPCFGETIASLSLLSTCMMRFERGISRSEVLLRPRSLLVLKRAARWAWTHAIPARKSDVIEGCRVPRGRRISITFRNVFLDD